MSANGVTGIPAKAVKENQHKDYAIGQLSIGSLSLSPVESCVYQGNQVLSAIVRVFDRCADLFKIEHRKEAGCLLYVLSRTNYPRLNAKASEWGLRESLNDRQKINALMDKILLPPTKNLFKAITGHKSKGLESDVVLILCPNQFPLLRQRSMFLRFFGDTPENLVRDELNLFYVACSRAKTHLFFLADNAWSSSPFLEGLGISQASWNGFPHRRLDPLSVYVVDIRPQRLGDASFKAAGVMLRALGFSFDWQNAVPIRRRIINGTAIEAMSFLKKVIRDCQEYNLIYIVKDGFNREILRLPGPVSIDAFLESSG